MPPVKLLLNDIRCGLEGEALMTSSYNAVHGGTVHYLSVAIVECRRDMSVRQRSCRDCWMRPRNTPTLLPLLLPAVTATPKMSNDVT